jgi:PTH1 family peptidyl-tRNA hydrolase
MNLSGDFLRKLLTKNKIKPTEILVIHDDSDIELGKYKFSFNRNSAGHKGVQSIIDQLKTKAIWRLRIGIREQLEKNQKMPNKRLKAGKIVLQKISKKHWDILQKETFPKITEDLMQTLRTNS